MATETNRFGLYKANPEMDGEDTFNLKTLLNDNWDKLDSQAVILSENGKVESGQLPLSSSVNSTSETEAATPKAVKTAYDLANGKESPAGTLTKIEQTSFKKTKSGKDAEGIYTTVEHRRKSDNTLARKSVLSGGTSPLYTTRTITYYAANGTTLLKIEIFTLTYDSDGVLISEV